MKELQQRQLLAAQWLSQSQSAQQQRQHATQNKKQREVYVGNLSVGVVTQDTIRELFDTVMSQILPAATAAGPPVLNIVMDPSQKFGFVELRSEALATAAINLDKLELCGRPINVGRPKGYVEPPPGYVPSAVPVVVSHGGAAAQVPNPMFPNMGGQQPPPISGGIHLAAAAAINGVGGTTTVTLPAATAFPTATEAEAAAAAAVAAGGSAGEAVRGLLPAAGLSTATEPQTTFLCVENMVPLETLHELEAREDVELDVREECEKYGTVLEILVVPPPLPATVGANEQRASRVFVSFGDEDAAGKARRMLHHRTFDDNVVTATFVGRGVYEAATRGEWAPALS